MKINNVKKYHRKKQTNKCDACEMNQNRFQINCFKKNRQKMNTCEKLIMWGEKIT